MRNVTRQVENANNRLRSNERQNPVADELSWTKSRQNDLSPVLRTPEDKGRTLFNLAQTKVKFLKPCRRAISSSSGRARRYASGPFLANSERIRQISAANGWSQFSWRNRYRDRLVQIVCQAGGKRSRVSCRAPANHRVGAITILSGLAFSQAPHQLKELLAMIWCLHRLMRRRSS